MQIKERKKGKTMLIKENRKETGQKKEQKTIGTQDKKTEIDRKQKLSVKFKMAERRKYEGAVKKYGS